MTDEITLDAPETRLERFLAAAAGMDGITLDEPETRVEKYLYKIAQGSGGVPAVEDADKGKYLHANESTGDLEWATPSGGGGGVLVVNGTLDMEEGTVTLDKTYGEMESALEECPFAVAVINTPSGKTICTLSIWSPYTVDSYYYAFDNMGSLLEFNGDNGTDYPVAYISGGGN